MEKVKKFTHTSSTRVCICFYQTLYVFFTFSMPVFVFHFLHPQCVFQFLHPHRILESMKYNISYVIRHIHNLYFRPPDLLMIKVPSMGVEKVKKFTHTSSTESAFASTKPCMCFSLSPSPI